MTKIKDIIFKPSKDFETSEPKLTIGLIFENDAKVSFEVVKGSGNKEAAATLRHAAELIEESENETK